MIALFLNALLDDALFKIQNYFKSDVILSSKSWLKLTVTELAQAYLPLLATILLFFEIRMRFNSCQPQQHLLR